MSDMQHLRQTTRTVLSELLVKLADGGALLDGLVGPNVEAILLDHGIEVSDAKNFGKYLIMKELITEQQVDAHHVKVFLTLAGWKRVQRFKVKNLQVARPASWDKKWRMVMFDIPERFKVSRNAITVQLKKMGFVQLQRSVWVYPFECQDEIGMLSQLYGVDHFMVYLVVEYTNADNLLFAHFPFLRR